MDRVDSMVAVVRKTRASRWSRVGLLSAALLCLAFPAAATPLGLQVGDVVTQIEWDADKDVGGDGGSYVAAGGGAAEMDGRLTSVTVQAGPTTSPLSGVDFNLNVDFSQLTTQDLGGGLWLLLAEFTGSASFDPDIVVTDNTGIILEANFTTPLVIGGVVDTNNFSLTPSQNVQASNITIAGGDSLLVAALGGIGGGASLKITGTIFDFDPTLAVLAGDDLDPFDDDFTFSGTGLITPTSPTPFVPEPSTAVLVGIGLAGLALRRRRA